MQSVMSHSFSQVPRAEIPRSQFSRSHGVKTTFDAGYLIPIYADEVYPGDTFNCKLHAFARMATPLAPIMDNIKLDYFFFYVPLRLLQANFKKLMGEQRNPGDTIDYLVPTMTSPVGGYLEHSLSDYLGIPTKIAGLEHSSYWHRAYNMIWNEWFRDENLQDSVVVDTDDGPDADTDYVLLKRGKRHDYFTSCLPWPQKGDAVLLPLGDKAPLHGIGTTVLTTTTAPASGIYDGASGASTVEYANAKLFNTTNWYVDQVSSNGPLNVYADLTNATAATIVELRQAFQVQRMLERDARSGTRYIEVVKAHFGVISPDGRQQRPELLGLGSANINIHPVAQTSETGTTPQGNLSAFATGAINGGGFIKSFTEHGVLLGLVSARADLTYQNGLNRMFSRQTRLDFYFPSLQHIGEQSVLNKEIYAQATAADNDVFGYQERFAELKYKPSLITGKMRSNATGTLDIWHLSQEFGSLPVLDETFIQENPPIDRVVATPTEPDFILDAFLDIKTARPMSVYSVPGMIDHL